MTMRIEVRASGDAMGDPSAGNAAGTPYAVERLDSHIPEGILAVEVRRPKHSSQQNSYSVSSGQGIHLCGVCSPGCQSSASARRFLHWELKKPVPVESTLHSETG